jgi:glycosyltransferase involved in cell wall biosynthesis
MADPAALARAVASFAADPDASMQMGARGAAYVEAHASWAVRAQDTGRIIGSAIHGR